MVGMTRGGDWAVSVYDRAYRRVHRLDAPSAVVPPVLCVELRRSRRDFVLPDGVNVHRGDQIGMIHFDNRAVLAIHRATPRRTAVGIQLRRAIVASLNRLASECVADRRFGDVRAFCVVTIYDRLLRRLGFAVEEDAVWWPRLVAGYQRRLVSTLDPRGGRRERDAVRAERWWISRDRLIEQYETSERRTA